MSEIHPPYRVGLPDRPWPWPWSWRRCPRCGGRLTEYAFRTPDGVGIVTWHCAQCGDVGTVLPRIP